MVVPASKAMLKRQTFMGGGGGGGDGEHNKVRSSSLQ